VAGLLAGCANVFPGEDPVPNPPSLPGRGVVFLFNGLTLPFEGVAGTGAYRLAQNIRQAGVRAEINRPSAWSEVADTLLRHAPLEQGPVAVYGYSYGAQAALHFARRLGQAGVPVQTLVALEAYSPVPVPCNVREAIHIYVSGAALVPVTPLVSEGSGCTRLRNVRFVPQGPAPFWLDHWSVSTLDELHRSVQRELLDGNRVRLREPAPRPGSP
jgi:pimeloyl-ACP methyl ester carboxylesterase